MLLIQDFYTWEAEKPNGMIIKKGGDLSDCIRFSLIPAEGIGLPQHDLIGVSMIRRFGRSFQKVRFGGFNDVPGSLGWEKDSNVVTTFEDLQEKIFPGYLIRQWGPEDICPWCLVVEVTSDFIKIDKPYTGRTAKKCRSRFESPKLSSEYLHCVVCKGFRMYIKSSTGAVLITPEEHEVYL